MQRTPHPRASCGETARLHLDLQVPTDVARVELTRQAILLCIAVGYADTELGDDVSMVATELLENALKYGKRGESCVHLEIREQDTHLVISVTNLLEGGQEVDVLQQRLEWLAHFDDPAAAFAAAASEVYARNETEEPNANFESKLGLVRIAHEGGCRIECDRSVSGQVTVRARRPLRSISEATRETEADT